MIIWFYFEKKIKTYRKILMFNISLLNALLTYIIHDCLYSNMTLVIIGIRFFSFFFTKMKYS